MRAPPLLSLWSYVSHWSRLLKFLILCSAAPLLARSQSLPTVVYLPVVLGSLLCMSYLSESDGFSVSRIAALLFFNLLLGL